VRTRIVSSLGGLVLLGAFAVSGAAEEVPGADLSRAIQLWPLADRALRTNPEIRAAERRLRAAEARPPQAGSLPDPMVSFRYRNDGLGRLTLGEEIMSQASVSLSQELPFPGKLGLRQRIAEVEAAEERARFRATVLGVITRLKVAYRDLVFVHRSIEIVNDSKKLLEQLEKSLQARYRTGQGLQQDVLKAQVEISKLLDRLVDLRQKRASAEAELNSLLDRPADAPLGAPEPPPDPPPLPAFEELVELAEKNSPMLDEAEKAIERERNALSLARREYLPDLLLMGGYMNRGALPDMWEAGIGVKIPLYFWRKQRYGVAEAIESLSGAQSLRQNARQTVLARIRDLHATAARARELAELYRGGVLPQATLSLESAAAGYRVGRVDFLTYLDAFLTLLEYKVRYYEEVANLGKAVARLEEVVGVELEKRP
jgi:outer membrane protein TolC